MRPGQSSCRLLALLLRDLPKQSSNYVLMVHKHPSAHSLGGNSSVTMAAGGFVCVSVFVVCVLGAV